jgi:hypothetical protein
MLLWCYMFRPYKVIFRKHLFKDSSSLYTNNIVLLRYAVDVPLYLFDIVELRRCLATLDRHNEQQHI